MPIPVGALVRLSTKLQAQRQTGRQTTRVEELDVPAQREAIRKFLEQHPDWMLSPENEYIEVLSAFKVGAEDRDVLQDVFRDAKTGRIKKLIVWKNDRLSRRSEEYPMVLATLRRYGVEVWSVVDNAPLKSDTQMDKFMRFLEGWQAESESVNTSVRVSAALDRLRASGRWQGGRVPFGYDLVPVEENGRPVIRGGKLVKQLVPGEWAPVVRALFERRSAGIGVRTLAGWLNSIGAPTWGGVAWTAMAVRTLLRNPVYAGMVRRNPRGKHNHTRGMELVEGQHQAIVDHAVWLAVQDVGEGTRGARMMDNSFVLSGVIRCGCCGSPMAANTAAAKLANGEHVTYRYYRCLADSQRAGCRESRLVRSDLAEREFVAHIERLTTPGDLASWIERRRSSSQDKLNAALEMRQRWEAEARNLERALLDLDDACFKHRKISLDDYVQLRDRYAAELGQIQTELVAPLPQVSADYRKLTELAASIRQDWEEWTNEERRAFARNFTVAWEVTFVAYPGGKFELKQEDRRPVQ